MIPRPISCKKKGECDGESAMRQGEKCGLGSIDGESVQVKVASARDKRTRIVKVPTSTTNLRHHCGGA